VAKRKITYLDKFERKFSMVTESGHEVSKGDLIKIAGEYGAVFKFQCLVKNPQNGVEWIDCFQMLKDMSGPTRSFYPDRVKAVKKRGKRVKRSSVS
jgi:hypothetical protein